MKCPHSRRHQEETDRYTVTGATVRISKGVNGVERGVAKSGHQKRLPGGGDYLPEMPFSLLSSSLSLPCLLESHVLFSFVLPPPSHPPDKSTPSPPLETASHSLFQVSLGGTDLVSHITSSHCPLSLV